MTETRKRVPAKRHDPEMDNFVYKGGQSLRAKGQRAAGDNAGKPVTTTRNGRSTDNAKQ